MHMKTIMGICTGLLLVLGLFCLSGIAAADEDTVLVDDVQAYNGPVGPGSPLYGLKLAFEDLDESFTANETERVEKQIEHGKLRLAEVRRSLDLNQSDSAEVALNNYWLKMNLTNMTISRWASNATGLLHAQEMIIKHQMVLQNLLANNTNNTGLWRAYNNSLRLEERFAEKTAVRYERMIEKNNRTILKAIRLEQKEHDRKGWPEVTTTTAPVTTTTSTVAPDEQGKGKGKQTVTTRAAEEKKNQQNGPGDDKEKGNAGDKGNGKNK